MLRWPAFLLYAPVLAVLSYRAVLQWPRPVSFIYAALLAVAAWRALRIGKGKEKAEWPDVVVPAVICSVLLWRQLTISPP